MWELRCANIKEQIRCLLLCCYFKWFANRRNRLQWGQCGCKWERQRWWLWAVSSIFFTNMINCPFDGASIYLYSQCSLDGLFKYSTPLLCMVCYQKKKCLYIPTSKRDRKCCWDSLWWCLASLFKVIVRDPGCSCPLWSFIVGFDEEY